ncbi:hypothetical protein ACFQ1S_40940, partial [Kibdelosporangium lantanae]
MHRADRDLVHPRPFHRPKGIRAVDVTDSGPRTVLSGLLRADALSAFMLVLIGAVIAVPAVL